MNKLILALVAGLVLTACGKATQEQKIAAQLESVHPLTADERQMAATNAKKFFEKEWIAAANARGQFNECRPSDSNANGLVTCFGFVPQPGGSYAEVKRFCGYRPELVGCSNEDTTK